jgi:hypothetical protein
MNETATLTRAPAATKTATPESLPNGPGAAAILSAGLGCATLGILALAGDAFPAVSNLLNFYKPSGALSGVSTLAVVVWLVAWFFLSRAWATKTVAMVRVNLASFVLLAVGVLLTFPPVMDLIQGK